MRVIAGQCRSMPLKTPKGTEVRPTTDRIKETLFNILQAEVPGCVFADLFAGSGSIGIEALSRGARHCYFADNSRDAQKCIVDNLQFTKLTCKATLLSMDVTAAVHSIRETCDIIFLDPPYGSGLADTALEALGRSKAVGDDTIVIAELGISDSIDCESFGFKIYRIKEYKTNKHVFMVKRGTINENEKSCISGKL